MISDEQIKEIWHNTPTQGDPSGMKFVIVFARAVLTATPKAAILVKDNSAAVSEPILDECECGYGCPPGCGCRHSGESPALRAPASVQDDDEDERPQTAVERRLRGMSPKLAPKSDEQIRAVLARFTDDNGSGEVYLPAAGQEDK